MHRAPVEIRVDHREAGSGVPEALTRIAGVRLSWEQLDEADYVAKDLAIERKRADDFSASTQDRRLFQQIERLQSRYGRVIVLIEGDDLYAHSRLHPNALRGAVSYLAVLAGVSVIHSQDAVDSAALISTMARHAQHGLGYAIDLHHKPRTKDPQRQLLYLVGQLPGIGPALAKALLTNFGTARRLFTASFDELVAVSGVGPERARQILEILSRPFMQSACQCPTGAQAKEEKE